MSEPRVLVVEDSPANQMLVKTVLQRGGFDVKLANNAPEALAYLRTSRPDLILMDIQLPGQDGLSLTRELKARPETSSIPIVALTAHAMATDVEESLAAGCAGYIAKPIDTRRLADEVRRYLAGVQ
jgi:CheY-like chemotaxis protein